MPAAPLPGRHGFVLRILGASGRLFCLAALALAVLTALALPARAADRIPVVASFSILADLVRQVGGERVEVFALVGPNTDAHIFQPAPADARRLMEARLVVVNGLGFEGWLDRLVKASGYGGPVAVASRGIRPLDGERPGHSQGRNSPHAATDPHAWQDVGNVKIYVANIRDALAAADPDGKPHYERQAQAYLGALEALDGEVRAAFAGIPREARTVITSHDAFGYYGRAYGITFLAPQGVSGDSEPTARDVANLIRQIKRMGVKAIFAENISNPRMIERIVQETGAHIGGALYSDALSDLAGPAATYLALMRHNTRLLAEGLR